MAAPVDIHSPAQEIRIMLLPHRRAVLAGGLAGLACSALSGAEERAAKDAPIARKDPLKITKLETFLVKPRWLFLKIHTNAGITGLGEPILEGRAKTCAEAVKEIEPYLIGKDPRQVVHHWQAIYRHAFYRGGPLLTSALSGIDMALWDIKGNLPTGPGLGIELDEQALAGKIDHDWKNREEYDAEDASVADW
jgi:hypothetical protein